MATHSPRNSLPGTGTVFASEARTASHDSDSRGNLGCGLIIVLDVTAVPGVDTVTFTIQGQDPVSETWYDILASAALVAVGMTVLQVHPALTVVANETASSLMPAVWRLSAVHSGVGSFTYSAGAIATP